MSKSNREVVHEGWLIKSPPTKRILRARWRRRWFTLRHSGELPGQFFLEYYTDRNCRKLKGRIDLDQCEQVDAGLHFEQRKLKYPYMFDVKTPSRIYYLAADSELDMNNWVDCICQVCGLKAYSNDEQEMDLPVSAVHDLSEMIQSKSNIGVGSYETPPLSPISTISGPYIPISECITGRPLTSSLSKQDIQLLLQQHNVFACSYIPETESRAPSTLQAPPTPQKRAMLSHSSADIPCDLDPRFYDSPRQLQPFSTKCLDSSINTSSEIPSTPPLQSPTDSESVFTDDEWSHPVLPSENGLKEPRPSDSSVEVEPSSWSVVQRFGKLTVVDSNKTSTEFLAEEAPPRPPKPSHLGKGPSYLNLETPTNTLRSKSTGSEHTESAQHIIAERNAISHNIDGSNVLTDTMYDFPRSHQVSDTDTLHSKNTLPKRHCYNNAAPSSMDGQVFRYDIASTQAMSHDASHYENMGEEIIEEPASPCSQSSCSTTALYSNLPSPSLLDSQSGIGPPVVNRTLKPGRKLSDSASICSLTEPSSPRGAPSVDRKLKPSTQVPLRKPNDFELDPNTLRPTRAAPSPIPNSFVASEDDPENSEQIYFYQINDQFLAAPQGSKDFDKLQYLDLDLDSDLYSGTIPSSQIPKSPEALTVYKTVDFIKTEAFRRTRQDVEAERKQCSVEP